ncbi:ABC transporter substrate-binding protein [Kineococcus gypseus]|uniref:ABC transporter substrate-binding protein n=1 Tax=Kineococcus gypseus TaxID=1637102 RepID=UPI003D7EDA35
MRRRTLLTTCLTGLGALAATAACGDGGEDGGAAAPSASGASGADAGAFPVTVEHAFGSTVVPEVPQRVVTVGFNDQDFALALGVTPVGVREYLSYDYAVRPWARDLLPAEPLPEVGGQDLNLEAVAALTPDLVLGTYSFVDQAVYDRLSAVAPTVADLVPEDGGTSASWRQQLAATGAALGRLEEAAELTRQVEDRFAAARAEHPEFTGRVTTVVLVLETGYYVLEAADPRARFFTDLGLTPTTATGELSRERAAVLDTDVLVVLGATGEQFTADPLAAALAVVREGRTVYAGEFSGDFAGALGFASPLSLPFAIERAVPQLALACDDDPSTAPEQL